MTDDELEAIKQRFIARGRYIPDSHITILRLIAEIERLKSPKMFPTLPDNSRDAAPGPTQIPWSVADKAYHVYRSRHGGSQSLERLAERGGFGHGELDDLYPGWRDEVDEIERLRAKHDEHPDDAEPVTEERLVAMLGPQRTLEMGCGFSITFYANAVPKLTVSQGRVSGYGSWRFEHKINLPKCETMADVRRLIAALKGE